MQLFSGEENYKHTSQIPWITSKEYGTLKDFFQSINSKVQSSVKEGVLGQISEFPPPQCKFT